MYSTVFMVNWQIWIVMWEILLQCISYLLQLQRGNDREASDTDESCSCGSLYSSVFVCIRASRVFTLYTKPVHALRQNLTGKVSIDNYTSVICICAQVFNSRFFYKASDSVPVFWFCLGTWILFKYLNSVQVFAFCLSLWVLLRSLDHVQVFGCCTSLWFQAKSLDSVFGFCSSLRILFKTLFHTLRRAGASSALIFH